MVMSLEFGSHACHPLGAGPLFGPYTPHPRLKTLWHEKAKGAACRQCTTKLPRRRAVEVLHIIAVYCSTLSIPSSSCWIFIYLFIYQFFTLTVTIRICQIFHTFKDLAIYTCSKSNNHALYRQQITIQFLQLLALWTVNFEKQ
jgi:hypothetical protein